MRFRWTGRTGRNSWKEKRARNSRIISKRPQPSGWGLLVLQRNRHSKPAEASGYVSEALQNLVGCNRGSTMRAGRMSMKRMRWFLIFGATWLGVWCGDVYSQDAGTSGQKQNNSQGPVADPKEQRAYSGMYSFLRD